MANGVGGPTRDGSRSNGFEWSTAHEVVQVDRDRECRAGSALDRGRSAVLCVLLGRSRRPCEGVARGCASRAGFGRAEDDGASERDGACAPSEYSWKRP